MGKTIKRLLGAGFAAGAAALSYVAYKEIRDRQITEDDLEDGELSDGSSYNEDVFDLNNEFSEKRHYHKIPLDHEEEDYDFDFTTETDTTSNTVDDTELETEDDVSFLEETAEENATDDSAVND